MSNAIAPTQANPPTAPAVVGNNPPVPGSFGGPLPLTEEEFRAALPDKIKKTITKQLIDAINTTLSNPDHFEEYRNNLISYTRVLQDGKFKIEQYLNAVKYASFRLMGRTQIDSYSLTFPDKMARFSAQGVDAKDIASYVTAYNKSKLVNLILEQAMVPTHVLNQDLYQKALNVQADLMMNAKSEMVRTNAANSILVQLKMPETAKVELNVRTEQSSVIDELNRATMELVAQQRQAIQAGVQTAQQVAHSKLMHEVVDVEAKEVQ